MLLWSNIDIRAVAFTDGASIKLALNPITGDLYILNPGTGLRRIQISKSDRMEKVANPDDIVEDAFVSGMAFGPDGVLYVVANRTVDNNYTQAIIRKGTANDDGEFQWETLAETEPYPLGGTPFDHLFNGIVVDPDGNWVYVNSGSRTDHGEEENNGTLFQDVREVPLTARILRIPSNAINLTLENNEGALEEVTFARGTRNAFDLEFAPNGDLFGVDNGPDADYPDELNWLREDYHYGFPWKFGDQDNPQQFPDYTSIGDKRLSPDFTAVRIGAYRRDPEFPKSPGGFTLPVLNLGPDADQYRADDGSQHDASEEGIPLFTFTPHRSPLGLAFATSANLPPDYRGDETTFSAFLLSWGSAGGTLTDRGQDLLHLQLTKNGDNYEAVTTQIASGFNNPIDSVLIGNRLYVLDYGSGGTLWELTFK
ncbi:MAG TPA: PQQ-dependent sugar dehydrogenase [Anaerolineales bacterium]|nr:PQQ-dependent sugar dehydrogenase [Anaerolineales bacterium]